MSRKRRASGFPTLGDRNDFVTMRESDNRFYWISSDTIHPNFLNSAGSWRSIVTGAKLSARILEGNNIHITSKGLNQVTVWLGKDAQGREMIDFTKPVNVRWNGTLTLRNVKATPNLAVMLEDLYQRGDRQQMVMTKLEMGK